MDNDDWDRSQSQWPDEGGDLTDVEEDDSLEDADLAFITSILKSFSKPKSKTVKHNAKNHSTESFGATFTPEGALTQADAKPLVTPPKFNYNSTIKRTTAEKLSCSPTAEEEGTYEFLEVCENKDGPTQRKRLLKIFKAYAASRKTRTILLQHGNHLSPTTGNNMLTQAHLLSLGG